MLSYGLKSHSGNLFVGNWFQIFYSAGIVILISIGISNPALIKGVICATNIKPLRGWKNAISNRVLLHKSKLPLAFTFVFLLLSFVFS
jgi:hypothetical protein